MQYEGLHLLCKQCGFLGHIGRNCSTVNQTAAETTVVAEMIKDGGAGDACIEATINVITGNNDVNDISIPKINDYHE